MLHEYSSDYSLNCDEAIFGVQKALLNMFWEHSPSSMNTVSDWLRAKSSPVDEEKNKTKKWTRVSLDTSLALEDDFFYLLTCGSPVSGTQNEIVVS